MMKRNKKQHFSHEHILLPLPPEDDGEEEITCNGCKYPIDEQFYGCLACKFRLHEDCAEAPRSVVHPSHPSHPLALHENSTYPSRAYICNACGTQGSGFNFSCAHCSFDIHVRCLNLPPTFLLKKVHPHELKLICEPEKLSARVFCSACDVVDKGFWVYYCGACKFGMHMSCLISVFGDVTDEDEEEEDEEEELEEEFRSALGLSDNEDAHEFYSLPPPSLYSYSSSSTRSSGARGRKQRPQQTPEDRIAQKLVLDALNAAADYVGTSYHHKRSTRRHYFR
ncbi:hypothetical protein ABFS83_02G128100 [Erythranthe nasuta]